MGNLGVLRAADQSYLTTRGREFVVSFWEFAAFLANSVVFLLIGVDVAGAPYHSFTARMLIGAVAAALAGRALAVYPISLAFRRTRWFVTPPTGACSRAVVRTCMRGSRRFSNNATPMWLPASLNSLPIT